MVLLKYYIKEKNIEKIKIKLIVRFIKGNKAISKNPQNKASKKGITIKAIGIKYLKLSSKVKDIVIQYIPLRKNP